MSTFEEAAGRTNLCPSRPLPRPLPSLPAVLMTRLERPNLINDAAITKNHESCHSDCSTAPPSDADADDVVHRTSPTCSTKFKLKNKKVAKQTPTMVERSLETVAVQEYQTIPAFRPPPGLPAPPPGLGFIGAEVNHGSPTLSFATPPIAESSEESDDSSDGGVDCPVIGKYRPGCLFQREAALVHEQQDRCILNLAQTISCSCDMGSFGIASAGSAGHYLGLCKPCDFVHRGGCRLGVECQYCHLCAREEGRNRKKEKKRSLKVLRKLDSCGASIRL